MDIEDLNKKHHFVHTVVPVLYWINVINTDNFSVFDFRFLYLSCGISLIAIQLVFLNIYTGKIQLRKDTVTIETSKKLSNWVVIFIGIICVYGFNTFIYMWANPKNAIIWTLISIYIIGISYIVLMLLYIAVKYRKGLKDSSELIKLK
jgi:hypothetical protein